MRGSLVVGIDASRNRSGGAKTHLLGMLRAVDPRQYGIGSVHVWAYARLLRDLPDVPWLVRHNPPSLEKSLLHQLWWQYRELPRLLRSENCDMLLTTDAGSICPFSPAVVMSRDMLSFEPNEMQRFGLSIARLRLLILRNVQVRSLKRATGAIFLTRYAARVIQQFTGQLPLLQVIPHGIDDRFTRITTASLDASDAKEIRCLYVSNTDLYKHQWHVVRAIARLRKAGHPISLVLVGARSGKAGRRLEAVLATEDPARAFVRLVDAVPHDEVPQYLAQAEIFVFASSCENMPNTLVEAMAGGLPIACSNRGPMPEVLQNAGVYFDPESPESIADAIKRLVVDQALRTSAASGAKALSQQYSWGRCARETWTFLAAVWREKVRDSRPAVHRASPPESAIYSRTQ